MNTAQREIYGYMPCEEIPGAARGLVEKYSGNGAVLTDDGKPVLLILDISDDNSGRIIEAVIRARAMEAFESMREIARQKGYMSDEEIETVINKSRQERRNREQNEGRN